MNIDKLMDMHAQILHELKSLGSRMSDIESKVHSMEKNKLSVASCDRPSSSRSTKDVMMTLFFPLWTNCMLPAEYSQR